MTTTSEAKTASGGATGPPEKKTRGSRRNIADAIRMAWAADARGFLVILVLTVLSGSIPPAVVWLTKLLVDAVALALTTVVPFSSVLPLVLGLGILAGLQRALGRVTGRRQQIYAERVEMHAEDQFLIAVSTCDAGHFDDPSWHDRVERASRDLSRRPSQLMEGLLSLGEGFVTMIGMGSILLTIHPLVLLLATVASLVIIPFQRRHTRNLYNFYFNITPEDRKAWYFRWMQIDNRAAKELRAFNLQEPLFRRFEEVRKQRATREAGIWTRYERYALFASILGGLSFAVAYGFVAFRGAQGAHTAGAIAALIGALSQFSQRIGLIAGQLVAMEEHATFLDDYFTFISLERLLDVPEEPVAVPKNIQEVEFEGVSFAYPGMKEKALKGVNLRIGAGELLALVGDNGAGKTTLVKLLCRFYDPQEGTVRIGGVDLKQTDPQQVRSRAGVLFQDAESYLLTAREAVTLGRPEKDGNDSDVHLALQKARAEEVVEQLPKGLDNYVGRMFEGGHDLSGGEWQRLALARLMYRDADVWVLDEPTASLDPSTEVEIFAELKENLRGRVGIVISHRFSTVRVADRIAVVQDGQITEIGTHEELIALGGRYAELFNLQAAGYR